MKVKIKVPKKVLAWVNEHRKSKKLRPIKNIWWTGLENFNSTEDCPFAVALKAKLTGHRSEGIVWFSNSVPRIWLPKWVAEFIWSLPEKYAK